MYVGVCVYLYTYICLGVCLNTCMCTVGCSYDFKCVVMCDSDPDPFRRFELSNGRPRTWFRFVPIMYPIHRQFEDRPMGWSGDLYQFVQWRPDGDSVPKLRHFMWVFVLVYFIIYRYRFALTCYSYHLCDFLLYFTSLITCTTSWDIHDCSL